MNNGCYVIKNTLNGRMYIGQTIDVSRRIDTHFGSLIKGTHHSYKLQNDYSEDNNIEKYSVDILESLEPDLSMFVIKMNLLYWEASYHIRFSNQGITMLNVVDPLNDVIRLVNDSKIGSYSYRLYLAVIRKIYFNKDDIIDAHGIAITRERILNLLPEKLFEKSTFELEINKESDKYSNLDTYETYKDMINYLPQKIDKKKYFNLKDILENITAVEHTKRWHRKEVKHFLYSINLLTKTKYLNFIPSEYSLKNEFIVLKSLRYNSEDDSLKVGYLFTQKGVDYIISQLDIFLFDMR